VAVVESLMLRFSLTTLTLACAMAAALAAVPAGAVAAPYMVSVMQDDNQLVYGNLAQRRNALNRMQGMGVEAVRVTLLWKAIAPGAESRRKPRGFNGANPRDYPRHLWDPYDSLVVEAAARGIEVNFNPTGIGPRWAHKRTRVKAARRSYKPDPGQFRKFVRAAGRRYSGSYRDENSGRQRLPRVSWWAIWNEPNQPGWLTPQSESKPGVGMIAMAPHIYRELVVAGAKALLSTGHGDDLLLIGELAPLGSARKPDGVVPSLRPGLFLPEMFCLNRRYRPFKGRAAEARGCDHVDRLGVLERFPRLGLGHHPYTRKRSPRKRERHRDIMNIGNVGALVRSLDRIAKRTGLLPPQTPIFFTEFGYQTLPPDPFRGVSLEDQAEYINDADFIAWRHPRVFSQAQFQLYDVPPRTEFPRDTPPYWATYQSGLFTALPDGTAKPAVNAYKFPLVVRRRGGTARIWGQVRFAPNGATYPVALQERARGSSTWVQSGGLVQVTHSQGYFRARRPARRGSRWRAVWSEPDYARFEISREAVAR
jgi:hypothetical protein